MPRASFMSGLLVLGSWWGFALLIQRPDDQRVDRRVLRRKPARRDRAGRDQHPLADPRAEHVERDQRAAVVGLNLEERPTRDRVHPAGLPHRSSYGRPEHLVSFSISTCSDAASSRASGVSTAAGASTSRARSAAARRTTPP